MPKAKNVEKTPSGKLKYRGETFDGFNKPKVDRKTKHKRVVLAKKGDEVKLVRFGHDDYGHNYSKEARKNYLKRSAGIKGKDDKFSANYWSRKVLWAGPGGSKKNP